MKLAKRILLVLSGLLVLAALAVYLIPLDTYLPQVEHEASRQLQVPVSIQHLRAAALPLPHLELQEVHIGEHDGITVKSVVAELNLPALLSGDIVLQRIVLRDGKAHLGLLRALLEQFTSTPTASQSVQVRQVSLSGMTLIAPELTLGALEGSMEFAVDGQLERAHFSANEQKIMATLSSLATDSTVPPARKMALQVQAKGWTLAKFPQYPLDELQLEGMLGAGEFKVQKFAVTSRGIRIAGGGRLNYADGWRIEGRLAQLEAPLERLETWFGHETVRLAGRISAQGSFSASADDLDALKDRFEFSGPLIFSNASVQLVKSMPHPLLFDEIRTQLVALPEQLQLNALKARVYGGELSGAAQIDLRKSVLNGNVRADNIAMRSLVQAFTGEVLFLGNLDSAAGFTMRLDALERFPENLQLNGNFHVTNGVLTNVDLLRAATSPGKADGVGGETRFDDMTGLLVVGTGGYHFSNLKVTSGVLKAEGKMNVSPALQVNGMLDVTVKQTIGLVSIPMVVSGTVANPVVRPTKSAMAGAAVGTAILGPGLGTAAGAKVGGFLDRLFGNKDSKAAPAKPAQQKDTAR